MITLFTISVTKAIGMTYVVTKIHESKYSDQYMNINDIGQAVWWERDDIYEKIYL